MDQGFRQKVFGRGRGQNCPKFSNIVDEAFVLHFYHFFTKFFMSANIYWEGKMVLWKVGGTFPSHVTSTADHGIKILCSSIAFPEIQIL